MYLEKKLEHFDGFEIFGHNGRVSLTEGCDLRATFERPKKWSGRSEVAETQKILFLCDCCSTTLVPSLNDHSCHSGTTGRTKEAGWKQHHCYVGSRVTVGRRMEAQWSSQRSLSGRYWSNKWGTPVGTRRNNNVFTMSTRRRWRRVDVVKTLSLRHYRVMCPLGSTLMVQGRQKHRSNRYKMFTTVRIFFTGRPVVDPCASILRPRLYVCLPTSSFERPVSDRPPRRPFCDSFEHV